MKLAVPVLLFILLILPSQVNAQVIVRQVPEASIEASLDPQIASLSAQEASAAALEREELERLRRDDLTIPEETSAKQELLDLFANRSVEEISPLNFIAYFVQSSVRFGVPANTIILILLLPVLATAIVFFRQIIGLPSLELLVPIAISITLVSTGLDAGVILFTAIFLAIIFSRITLKKLRIMQLPKVAISMFVVSLFVFLALTASASWGVLSVRQLSFFPILLVILLSDKFFSIQSSRGVKEITIITVVTLALGVGGYLLLTSDFVRRYLLLYPELILFLLPANLIMGRYFGLRLSEVYRFAYLRKHANK